MGKITRSPYFSGNHRLTYAKNPFAYGTTAIATALYDHLSTGFDTAKGFSKTGTKTKKIEKLKPKQIAVGWYVDYMSGFLHKFPKSFNAIVNTTGKLVFKTQTPIKQDCVLSRVNQVQLFNGLPLTEIQALTDPNVTTYVTTTSWKLTWTNLSNIKICYEYYYVTPIGEQATTFQAQIGVLTDSLNTASGYNNVFTQWRPEDTPQLLKNWRILSKSVFRLSPGETGEIHCKDRIYAKFGDAIQLLDRTYAAKYNTQLYCRWYGAPTALATITVPPAEPVAAEAVYGVAGAATSWIMESETNYYRGVLAQPNQEVWNTTVPASVGGGQYVVTQENEDQEVVQAQ